MKEGLGIRHDHTKHVGWEDRRKFQSHPGIMDALKEHEKRRAEGKPIKRSEKGQRSARESLIEKWHARRKSGWNPETGACP